MQKFCLLGHNIGYSLSPKVHSLIYAELGLNASYTLFDVEQKDFESSLVKLKEFDGFNVTKPYKTKIIPYLNSVVCGNRLEKKLMCLDSVQIFSNKNEHCKAANLADLTTGSGVFEQKRCALDMPQEFFFKSTNIDAVNTVKNGVGYNTDYGGFLKHIITLGCFDKFLIGLNALVLGAGGVAQVVVPALKQLGISVSIYNRTLEKAKELAKKYDCNYVSDTNGTFGLVVNCTSIGLNAGENCATNLDLSKTKMAYDTIYFDTEFLKSAKKAGVKIVANGLGMLVHQAIRANEIFFDITIENKNELATKVLKELTK